MCARVCAREPRVCASAPPYTRPGSASGAWHVWQAAGGARVGRAAGRGSAPARTPRTHAQRVPGATLTQPIHGLTFSTYLVPCFHGLVLTYYVQEVAQHSATPPFVLAAKWKTCSMLNVVWPYMGSGQWTAKVNPRLVACYYVVVHQAKLMSLVEELGSPGRFAVRNRSLALRAIGSATACTTGSDSATRLPVCVRRLFVRLKRLFDRLK